MSLDEAGPGDQSGPQPPSPTAEQLDSWWPGLPAAHSDVETFGEGTRGDSGNDGAGQSAQQPAASSAPATLTATPMTPTFSCAQTTEDWAESEVTKGLAETPTPTDCVPGAADENREGCQTAASSILDIRDTSFEREPLPHGYVGEPADGEGWYALAGCEAIEAGQRVCLAGTGATVVGDRALLPTSGRVCFVFWSKAEQVAEALREIQVWDARFRSVLELERVDNQRDFRVAL